MTTGSVLAQFTITLSQAVSEQVAVEWHTADGTALAGVDYAAAKGTVLFAPGETAKTVDILVYGRAVGSEDRSFFVEMLPPVNAILGASIGECIIHVDTSGDTPVTQIIVPTGPKGDEGESAYQLWLKIPGNEGKTEEGFFDSFKPDPAEIAEEIAPLINVGNAGLTSQGTEALATPDTTTVKAVARRVAYALPAKIATVVLADGDNTLSPSDLSGDTIDFASVGFMPLVYRAGAFSEPVWQLNANGSVTVKSVVAGDVLYAIRYSFISEKNSRTEVAADVIKQLTGSKAGNAGAIGRGRLLSELVNDSSLEIGQSYVCTDRAGGVFDVVSSLTYGPNGYTTVLVTAKPSLALRLRVYGNTIDLEQAGGKPYRAGTQEVDCKQALQECFYLLLDAESATIDLKSEKWLLSQYEFNDLKQRRKIKGNNAVIYSLPDNGTNYDFLISTAWNYQDIDGVTLDLRFNPRYACALRVTHGYGRYSNMNIRKSRCMIQVGIADTNQVSLSEFMFHNLRGEQNAKIAVVHGLYSVLNISDSIVPCGEGDFWKTYDCTGFTIYGGRVFITKSGCNSNVINNDNPYVYCANSTVDGLPYIGSFSAVQCDFELRTRFCIVQDLSTAYQDYQQAVTLEACRVGVYASLDARAKKFFESTVGYRGILRIKNTDLHFDAPLTLQPIAVGGHTITDIDYAGITISNFRGPKVVNFSGYPPLLPYGTLFQSNIGANVNLTNGNFINFSNPVVGLDTDVALLSYQWDTVNKKFSVPVSGLSDVTVSTRITLANATAANVTVILEANAAGSAIGIARGVIVAGQTSISLSGRIRELPPGCDVYVITDSTSAYTLSNTGAYDTTLTIEASIRAPRVKS